MKKITITAFAFILFIKIGAAQNAKISVAIVNAKYFAGYISIYNPDTKFGTPNKGVNDLRLNNDRRASCVVNITQPLFVTIHANYTVTKGKDPDQYFLYALFITPGDDLTIKIDVSKKSNNIIVTGKGSNNNQPEIFALTSMDTNPFRQDASPNRIIAAINKQQAGNQLILKNYILKYKPSAAFIKNAQLNALYFAPETYYEFSHNNHFGQPETYLRLWQKPQDSLFATIKNLDGLAPKINSDVAPVNNINSLMAQTANLSNDQALTAYNYRQLIFYFLLREKERLWMYEANHPVAFYKEWYHTDVKHGKSLFNDTRSGLLPERIINKYFKGKTAEYAYAQLLKYNLNSSNYQNMPVVFDHFKQRFPNSAYINELSAPIAEVAKKQNQGINDKMIFVANNGSKLNTLKEVVAITKGKTYLVDMWGVWCSSCRKEIEKNSAALEGHFKGKNVGFLYVSNYDITHEAQWKKLIAYYHMDGMHILANKKLTDDIMTKIGGQGYPTYFIIKKDGSFQMTKTRYPVDKDAMIKELELASR